MLVKMVFNTRAELELGKSRRNAHRGEMSKRAAFTRLIGAARIVVDFRVSDCREASKGFALLGRFHDSTGPAFVAELKARK